MFTVTTFFAGRFEVRRSSEKSEKSNTRQWTMGVSVGFSVGAA